MRPRQARLIAFEAEYHDLRIHTDAGSDLLPLPEEAGARVHRGWWAVRAAARTPARRESKAELTLQGGLTVPLSRVMQASLRDQCRG